MLIVPCPYCGERPEIEFAYAGQAHLARPEQPSKLDDDAWSRHLYVRSNAKGIHAERWRHVHGCARYFNALRDTRNDRFLTSYRVGETQPEIVK